IIRALGRIGPAAKPAVTLMKEIAKNPDWRAADEDYLRLAIAQALWEINGRSEEILPMLKAGLSCRWAIHAIEIIGEIGRPAQELADDLIALSKNRDWSISEA